VLPEDIIQFQVQAVDTVGIPGGSCKVLFRVVHLRRDAILSYKEDNGLKDSPRASWPRRDVSEGCEDPASDLHTCVKVEAV
jgi:hypothetical protein